MSTELKVKGRIVKVMPIESGVSKAQKDWKKQNFVIDTGEQYNPEICFQMFGAEKCENLTKFNKVGDEVTVNFNVSSREFNGKYYHNLDAWMVKKIAAPETGSSKLNDSDTDSSDLPF